MNSFQKITTSLITIIVVLFLSASYSYAEVSHTLRGPDPRDIGTKSMDLTVYRTVNTLSCHPQNALLTAFPGLMRPEVPVMVSFNPNKQFGTITNVKGYCVAMHMHEYPERYGQEPLKTYPNREVRPKIPWRNYIVIEVPNPKYGDPTETKFTGKYIHWEGMYLNANSSITTAVPFEGTKRETWHNYTWHTNMFGGIDAGTNVLKFNRLPYTPTGTTLTQYTIDSEDASVDLKTCEDLKQARRPGDENLPCQQYSISLNGDNITGRYYWNPTNFTDIPHNKNGYAINPDDRSWVKCATQLPANYFTQNLTANTGFGTTNPPQVYAVTPQGCDYPAMTGNPSAKPLCLDQSKFGENTPIPTSMERCATSSPTIPPTATPTPTTSQPFCVTPTPIMCNGTRQYGTPTPMPNGCFTQTVACLTATPIPSIVVKPGDSNNDGTVNVQDYNTLVNQFNQTGTNLSADFNNSGKVDVQDYNILVTNFGK